MHVWPGELGATRGVTLSFEVSMYVFCVFKLKNMTEFSFSCVFLIIVYFVSVFGRNLSYLFVSN